MFAVMIVGGVLIWLIVAGAVASWCVYGRPFTGFEFAWDMAVIVVEHIKGTKERGQILRRVREAELRERPENKPATF